MRRLRLIISLIPLLLLVSGCRTEKEARMHTEYVAVYERDSVYVDCTDTLYVMERGDTVRITETKTVKEWRYKVLRDTARITDTVTVEIRTAAAADNPKPCKRWKFFVAGAVCAVFLIFAARILIKIYLKK